MLLFDPILMLLLVPSLGMLYRHRKPWQSPTTHRMSATTVIRCTLASFATHVSHLG